MTPIQRTSKPGDRTGASLGISLGMHGVVLLLLTLGVTAGPMAPKKKTRVDIELLAELPVIEEPAPPGNPGPGNRGVASRSAVKPKKTPKPAEKPVVPKKRASGLAEPDAPKPKRARPQTTAPEVPKLVQAERSKVAKPTVPGRSARTGAEVTDTATAPTLSERPAAPRPDALGAATLENRTARPAVDVNAPTARDGGEVADVAPSSPSLVARSERPAAPELGTTSLVSRSGGGVSDVDVTPSSGSAISGGVADADAAPIASGGGLVSRSGDVAGVRAGGVLSDRGGAPGGDLLEGGDAVVAGSESGRRTILDYGEGGGGGGGGLQGRARRDPAKDVAEVLPEDQKDADELEPQEVNLGGKGVSMSLSGEISDRDIVKAVPPVYPDQAKAKGWEGAVAVHFTVLPNGTVKDNVYIEQAAAHHVLNQAAMAAIKKWTFSPLETGKAQVEQWGILTIVFRLQ